VGRPAWRSRRGADARHSGWRAARRRLRFRLKGAATTPGECVALAPHVFHVLSEGGQAARTGRAASDRRAVLLVWFGEAVVARGRPSDARCAALPVSPR
jgi:hypothetical protein